MACLVARLVSFPDAPVPTSHSLMMPSCPPDASSRESPRLKSSECTAPVWPLRENMTWLVPMSHTITSPLSEPVASIFPQAETATAVRGEAWPLKSLTQSP
eukprot:CAMPEP_0173432284 /NCGR_PEP_ID=MMETSP1357-20121228/10135_1 /TAXON_ID=77926 /ORGANISM="Hemiselmis rufescens, Strain PCC563" /LENGTH=100 /DNA_ID=CAMNT_0014396859 /DNA_START=42 /DNA_END=344 /DNA_ORIENTATION=-